MLGDNQGGLKDFQDISFPRNEIMTSYVDVNTIYRLQYIKGYHYFHITLFTLGQSVEVWLFFETLSLSTEKWKPDHFSKGK